MNDFDFGNNANIYDDLVNVFLEMLMQKSLAAAKDSALGGSHKLFNTRMWIACQAYEAFGSEAAMNRVLTMHGIDPKMRTQLVQRARLLPLIKAANFPGDAKADKKMLWETQVVAKKQIARILGGQHIGENEAKKDSGKVMLRAENKVKRSESRTK